MCLAQQNEYDILFRSLQGPASSQGSYDLRDQIPEEERGLPLHGVSYFPETPDLIQKQCSTTFQYIYKFYNPLQILLKQDMSKTVFNQK